VGRERRKRGGGKEREGNGLSPRCEILASPLHTGNFCFYVSFMFIYISETVLQILSEFATFMPVRCQLKWL